MRWAGSATRRLIRLTLGLWAVVTASFLCLYILPGDPARIILGPQASAVSVEQFREAHGLDASLAHQYGDYVVGLARVDLGYSYSQQRPVRMLVAERLPSTLWLALTALGIAVVVGLAAPVIVTLVAGTNAARGLSAALQTIAFVPPYLLALGALALATGVFHVAPVLFSADEWTSWLLAALVLAVYPTTLLLRILVQSLAVELASPYVLRAAACGFSWRHIVLREALRNALSAPLASLANAVAYFFTSAFFIEAVFGIPGLGRLAQDAVRVKDLALLNGVCLVYCLLVGSTSVALDILQRRFQGSWESEK